MNTTLTLAALPLIAGSIILVGCGGAEPASPGATATRSERVAQQDGQWPESLTCPDAGNRASQMSVYVTNASGVPITMRSGDIDCYDWSGSQTPPSAFNTVVASGETARIVLNGRTDTDRNWRTRFFLSPPDSPRATGALLGEVRMRMATGYDALQIAPAATKDPSSCIGVDLGPAPAGSTPTNTSTLPTTDKLRRVFLVADRGRLFAIMNGRRGCGTLG